jgi:hypothetical protein
MFQRQNITLVTSEHRDVVTMVEDGFRKDNVTISGLRDGV